MSNGKPITITPVFVLKQKVKMIDINLTGRVVAYYYKTEIQYHVRYFDKGDVRTVYFYEDELKGD